MNERWHRHTVVALVLVVTMLASMAQLGRVAGAQEGTPVGAQPATPVPGAQTWHVLVNNVSPDGENWSFNTFYPNHLQVHPGDTIVFTLAPNPQAFHTVHLLALGMTPLEFYEGFSGGFIQPDLARPGEWQRTFFGFQAPTPCGRAGQNPCVHVDITDDISFGIASAVLVNPPPGGGEGNTSFTVTLDPAMRPGPYYVMSDVDGPTMIGRIDVVAPDQPVQAAGDLEAAAQTPVRGGPRLVGRPRSARVSAGSVEPGRHQDLAGRRRRWSSRAPSAAASEAAAYPAGTPQRRSVPCGARS